MERDHRRSIDSSPAAVRGAVYVGSDDAKLYAFNAEDGAPVWSATTGGPIDSSPAVGYGAVFVGSDDAKLHAFDKADGSPLWSATTGGPVDSSPAIGRNVVYVGSDDGVLYGLAAATGTSLWSATTGGAIGSSPGISNGTVHVASNDGSVHAFAPLFHVPVHYDAGGYAEQLAMEDFDANGRPDLALTNTFDDTVSVMLNDGNGGFAAPVTYPMAFPLAVAAGDFDGDASPDLAVTHEAMVSVLLNNGDGTFTSAVDYDAGGSSGLVAVGLFNADPRLDVAVTNGAEGTVSVLLNNGDGTFAAPCGLCGWREPDRGGRCRFRRRHRTGSGCDHAARR